MLEPHVVPSPSSKETVTLLITLFEYTRDVHFSAHFVSTSHLFSPFHPILNILKYPSISIRRVFFFYPAVLEARGALSTNRRSPSRRTRVKDHHGQEKRYVRDRTEYLSQRSFLFFSSVPKSQVSDPWRSIVGLNISGREAHSRRETVANYDDTHTRGVYTHEKTPFLLSGLAEPNWASTESSARGSTRKRAESDTSAISRIVWQPNPGRTRLSSPYHFALCQAVSPEPLSYPRPSHSNLPLFLLCIARESACINAAKHAYTRTSSRKSRYRASDFSRTSERFLRCEHDSWLKEGTKIKREERFEPGRNPIVEQQVLLRLFRLQFSRPSGYHESKFSRLRRAINKTRQLVKFRP